MFFVLSKTLGRLVEPTNFALALFGLAFVLRAVRRAPRLRRACGVAGAAALVLFSLGAVASALLYPLERAYERPKRLTRPPAAIVVLGGMLELDAPGESYFELTEAADRLVEGVRLARRYPRALLVLSGGSSNLILEQRRGAEVLGRLARELGTPADRLRLDLEARNTRENALYSLELLREVEGPVLLVTSASHMLRSVACFAKAGRKVVPWPVDYRRERVGRVASWIPKPSALRKSTAALREYFGLLAYRVAGYI
jgi:uncharacterized SAM-binding protein YcdF (DUF218 family)